MTVADSINLFFDLEKSTLVFLFKGCMYPWEAIENIDSYLKGEKLGKIEGKVSPHAHLIHPSSISIGKNTVVEAGAYIEGPCILGEGCVVRQGAYIREGVITGNDCVIGHATEVKHSILLDKAAAAHFNYVGDSILGYGVNLGAGVKCANFRLDHKPVSVHFEGKKIVTRLRKLGAIVGDGAQLGCNLVTNPGTLIGKKAFCYPCLNIGGYIPSQSVVQGKKGR